MQYCKEYTDINLVANSFLNISNEICLDIALIKNVRVKIVKLNLFCLMFI